MTNEKFLDNRKQDVFKFGRKPVAIDIMTNVKGLDFEKCYKKAQIFKEGALQVKTIHFIDLISAKKASGRYKDLDDIEQLTKE